MRAFLPYSAGVSEKDTSVSDACGGLALLFLPGPARHLRSLRGGGRHLFSRRISGGVLTGCRVCCRSGPLRRSSPAACAGRRPRVWIATASLHTARQHTYDCTTIHRLNVETAWWQRSSRRSRPPLCALSGACEFGSWEASEGPEAHSGAATQL